VFNKNKKLVIVYLSKRGCLAYTKSKLSELAYENPLLVVTTENKDIFDSVLEQHHIQTSQSKFGLLTKSLTIDSRIKKLLNKWTERHGDLELYFPAFHPWNLNFIKAANRQGIPTTLTIHDFRTHIGEQSSIIESLQKKMIKLSTHVHFLSHHVKSQAEKELGPQDKFSVTPHPSLSVNQKQILPHNPRPSLLFLGRVVSYKGVDLLLSAIEGLDIEKLTIAGQQVNDIKTNDKKTQIINKYLSDDEVEKLLASHHILVLPYREASQSGVIMHGLSAGVPMVITKVGGLPEQLPPEAAVWVEATVMSLRDGIKQLMENPQLYADIKNEMIKIIEANA